MALITLDSGDVWDNNASGSTYDAKFTTKVGPGVGATVAARFNTTTAAFRGITGDVPATRLSIVTGKLSFDTSYPTGGEAADVIAGMMPKGIVLGCYFEPLTITGTGASVAQYDIVNKKIKAYVATGVGTTAEVTAATNLSAITGIRFVAVGY